MLGDWASPPGRSPGSAAADSLPTLLCLRKALITGGKMMRMSSSVSLREY